MGESRFPASSHAIVIGTKGAVLKSVRRQSDVQELHFWQIGSAMPRKLAAAHRFCNWWVTAARRRLLVRALDDNEVGSFHLIDVEIGTLKDVAFPVSYSEVLDIIPYDDGTIIWLKSSVPRDEDDNLSQEAKPSSIWRWAPEKSEPPVKVWQAESEWSDWHIDRDAQILYLKPVVGTPRPHDEWIKLNLSNVPPAQTKRGPEEPQETGPIAYSWITADGRFLIDPECSFCFGIRLAVLDRDTGRKQYIRRLTTPLIPWAFVSSTASKLPMLTYQCRRDPWMLGPLDKAIRFYPFVGLVNLDTE